jgi:hypothetical protein
VYKTVSNIDSSFDFVLCWVECGVKESKQWHFLKGKETFYCVMQPSVAVSHADVGFVSTPSPRV